MLIEDIFNGESRNLEFKSELPKKSEKYIKSVIAFANTAGGKLVIGVDDKKRQIIGVDETSVFSLMDDIANTISDMCAPQIIPNIYFKTIEHKCLVIIEIYPGQNRPYFIKSLGKGAGTYVRVSGTSRPADSVKLKELELQGSNLSYDEMICIGHEVTDEAVNNLCKDIKRLLQTKNIEKNYKMYPYRI